MTANTETAANSKRSGPSSQRLRKALVGTVGGGVLLLTISAGVYLWRESPQDKVERARAVAVSDPERALQILDASLDDIVVPPAGAELLKCQLLAAVGREHEALAVFDAIQDPFTLGAGELLASAKAAQANGAGQLARKLLRAGNQPGAQQEAILRMLIALEYELEDFEAVIPDCRELAQLAPRDPMPWLVLAGIYHENEQVAEALDAYRHAVQLELPASESARVRYHIADLSLFIGDLPAAREVVDQLLADSPTGPAIPLLHARLLRNEGEPQEALVLLNRILTTHPKLSAALMLRGEINLDAGQFSQAIDDLAAVVADSPFNYQAHYKLGQAYLRAGEPEKAQVYLDRSRHLTDVIGELQVLLHQVRNDPSNRQLQLRLAELCEQQGDSETAEFWRESARRLP